MIPKVPDELLQEREAFKSKRLSKREQYIQQKKAMKPTSRYLQACERLGMMTK